jgi:hypothetical protein
LGRPPTTGEGLKKLIKRLKTQEIDLPSFAEIAGSTEDALTKASGSKNLKPALQEGLASALRSVRDQWNARRLTVFGRID